MNNQYAKFEYKGMKAFGVTDYTNLAPQKCCRQTNGRTDEQTNGEKTDEQTDGRSGPTTGPAFAKATQVKNEMCTK